MPDIDPPRLVLKVELISAASIEGSDEMLVALRTDAGLPLEVRLTRRQAADLAALIAAERARDAPAGPAPPRRAASAAGQPPPAQGPSPTRGGDPHAFAALP